MVGLLVAEGRGRGYDQNVPSYRLYSGFTAPSGVLPLACRVVSFNEHPSNCNSKSITQKGKARCRLYLALRARLPV